jgi:hypothetical protein
VSGRAGRWLAAAGLWAAALVVGALTLGWSSGSRAPADLVVSTTSALPAASVNSVALTENGTVVSANGPDPFLVLEPPSRPVRSVRLEIAPLRLERKDFYLYYVPAGAPAGSGFSAQHYLLGAVRSTATGWRVEWELAEPIRAYRLDVPDDASFKVVNFAASAREGALSTRPENNARVVLLFLVPAMLAFAGALVIWRPRLPDVPAIKRIAIGLLLLPLAVILFLLPPFQGPDEGAHWKMALASSRRAILTEPSAYLLPDILDPVPMRFKPEVKFDPSRLEIDTAGRPLTREEFDADQRTLRGNYPYARVYAYPSVTALALLYPRIDGVDEAVLLFYLCRAVPALLLIGLLLLAQRRHDLPFTTIMFFSLPLVLQQSAVVTADILLNLGALGCALLYLRHREHPRRGIAVALWLLTLSIVGVKFIYAPLLLLPALTIPAGRPRRIAAAAAAGLALALAYPAIRMILAEVRAIAVVLDRSALADQQIASLATAAGWTDLLWMYGRYLSVLPHAGAWSGPLGWLDTPLSQAHLALIRASMAAAIVLDLWNWAPALRTRARGVGFAIAFGVAGIALACFVDVLLYYLMTTSPGATDVAGVQVRHFFPIAMAAVVLAAAPSAGHTSERGKLPRALAIATVAGLLLVRTILLAQDLLTRYW